MTILITGANGFVGRALAQALWIRGILFHTSGRSAAPVLPEVKHIQIATIGSDTDWTTALSNINVVIHLAAHVHNTDVMGEHSEDFYQVNLHGTANLACQASRAGIKRFVYVSSIKVNGEYSNFRQPFRERDKPCPQGSYAKSKWMAEQRLWQIGQDTDMGIVVVRPPLVYGPGVKANFARLLRLVDYGIPLPFSRLQNLRSLIYVENLADALIACAIHPAAAGRTYLVSDGEDISTPHLIRAISDSLNRKSCVFPLPVSLMHALAKLIGKAEAMNRLEQSLVVDSTKIHRELDWQPPYSLAQGLQATADWYRSKSR